MISDSNVTVSVKRGVPKQFRLLKWNELVRRDDFVRDKLRGFEPWEGPSGFRADAFVKPIYRRLGRRPAAAAKKITMTTLKLIYRTIIQLVKRVCLLPQTIAHASQKRQQQTVLNEQEAERIDRTRNPSKYLGK